MACKVSCKIWKFEFLAIFTQGQFWPSLWSLPASVCPCVCQSVCQSLACPYNNSGPVQVRITKFGPKMQKTLVKVSIVLRAIELAFKVKFNIKVRIYPINVKFDLKSRIFWSHHYWNYITTIQPPESHEYLDCFTGLTVSWSPSSVHTYIPRLFPGFDCFKVSTRCTYTDLGSRGYFNVAVTLV